MGARCITMTQTGERLPNQQAATEPVFTRCGSVPRKGGAAFIHSFLPPHDTGDSGGDRLHDVAPWRC